MSLVWVVGLAVVGGLVVHYWRVPGGVMLGSMIAVAAYALICAEAPAPLPASVITGAQMVLGALLLLLSYGLGLLLALLSGVDLATAVFSLAPGGMNYIAASAEATGANGGVVAVIHQIRIVMTIVIVPLAIQLLPLKE